MSFKQSTPNIDKVNAAGTQQFNQATPTISLLLSQFLEALKTGGITAQDPLSSRLLEAQKSQLAQGLTTTENDLGRTGNAKNPYGQGILANMSVQGEQGLSNIGTNLAQNFLSMFAPHITALQNAGLGGLGNAATAQGSVASNNNAANANILSSFTNLGVKGAAAVI